MTDTSDVLSMRIRPLNHLCRDPVGATIQTCDVSLRPKVLVESGLRNDLVRITVGINKIGHGGVPEALSKSKVF